MSPKKLTRPMILKYNCSEENYKLFLRKRDEYEISTGEMFDKLLNSSNSIITKVIAELDYYKDFHDKVMEQGGKV